MLVMLPQYEETQGYLLVSNIDNINYSECTLVCDYTVVSYCCIFRYPFVFALGLCPTLMGHTLLGHVNCRATAVFVW